MLGFILVFFGIIIAIYIACSKFLSNFNKLKYGKGTILAWLPFTSIYLMGKLAFNELAGWGLLIMCILSSSYTVTVNGVETVQTIAPASIQGPLSKIYPFLNLGTLVYCIFKYKKLKNSGFSPIKNTSVLQNVQPVQSKVQPVVNVQQPEAQQVQSDIVSRSQPNLQQTQQSVQPQPMVQSVQTEVSGEQNVQQVQTEVPIQHTEEQHDVNNQQPVQEEPKKFFNTEPIEEQNNQVSLDQVLNLSFDEVAQPASEHTEQQVVEQVVNDKAVEQSDLDKILNISFNEEAQQVQSDIVNQSQPMVQSVQPELSGEQNVQPIQTDVPIQHTEVQQNAQPVQGQVTSQAASTQQETSQNNNQ